MAKLPRNGRPQLVAEGRSYRVTTVAKARGIVTDWLTTICLNNAIQMGLPEIDDRHHIWRVALRSGREPSLGEVVIDAYTTEVLADKTTNPQLLEARLLKKPEANGKNEAINAIPARFRSCGTQSDKGTASS